MTSLEGLGAALRKLRNARGLTQAQAAQLCERLDQADVSRFEEAEGVPSFTADRLDRYLDGIGASLRELADALEDVQREAGRREVRSGENPAVKRYVATRAMTLERIAERLDRLEERVEEIDSGSGGTPDSR